MTTSTRPAPRRGLRRNDDFVKLWAGSSVSLVGSQVTFIALPLAAAITLRATPAQMGILSAAGTLPTLLLGLFAGVWVDRWPRRMVLLEGDVGRAALLGTIPILALMGLLRIEALYVVAFLAGVLTLFFDAAFAAYLSALVGREDLVAANSRLYGSTAVAETAGPALAGWLVQVLTAPVAVLADALSYGASALCVLAIRAPEPPRERRAAGSGAFRRELLEGLRFLGASRLLRALAGASGTLNFTGGVFDALLVLFITRDLRLGAAFYGALYTVGSLSGIGGALVAGRAARRLGAGGVMVASAGLIAVGWLAVPLAWGPVPLAIAVLGAGGLLFGLGNTLYNINAASLVQRDTPDHLLGRVRSTLTFVGIGTLPLGALAGGALGGAIGVRPTLLIAASVRFVLLALLLLPAFSHEDRSPRGRPGE